MDAPLAPVRELGRRGLNVDTNVISMEEVVSVDTALAKLPGGFEL